MLNFKLQVAGGFVLVTLNGLVSLDAWDEVLNQISAALPEDAPPGLVIDMRSVVGYLGVPERAAVGSMMAKRLDRMQKVAIVVEVRKITNVVHDEARRNGLDLQLFPDYDDSIAWVTS
jgi:hypothetical protein